MDLPIKGYQVLPCLPKFNKCDSIHNFHKTMQGFPEFLQLNTHETRVMGGFSALGNPSSFHNPMVRDLRKRVLEHVKPYMAQAAEYYSYNVGDEVRYPFLVQDFDRMLYRPTGVKATAEFWHRDMPKYSDCIHFGGWINLGDMPQSFHCIPESHLSIDQQTKPGFDNLLNKHTNAKEAKRAKDELQRKTVRVCVPPGHVLLFNSTIIHTISGTKVGHPQYRLFLSFRLQSHANATVQDVIRQQGVPLLPSGQQPPMFAKLHLVNWKPRVVDFSKKFVTQIPRNSDGCIPRFLPSLLELKLPMYPPYTLFDIQALQPINVFVE